MAKDTTIDFGGKVAIVDFAAEYIAEELFYKDQEIDVKSLSIAGVGAMNAVISGSVEFSKRLPDGRSALAAGTHE